eukprot:9498240-Pyramimonas_sp.AAC.1
MEDSSADQRSKLVGLEATWVARLRESRPAMRDYLRTLAPPPWQRGALGTGRVARRDIFAPLRARNEDSSRLVVPVARKWPPDAEVCAESNNDYA